MGIWGYLPILPFSQEFGVSVDNPNHPMSPRKLAMIGGLIVGVPVLILVAFAFFFFSSDMATADSGDHAKLVKLENELIQQNQTITNLANFIINQQIPFDQQLLNYTHSHP